MDGAFFYNDKILTARLKMLRSLAEGNDCLNFVIGEKGSGKTSLLKALLASAGKEWRRCNVRFRSSRNIHKVEASGNLHGPSGILLNTGPPPILIMDDAHEIDTDGLCRLLRHALKAGKARKFRGIILFCTPTTNGFVKTLSECLPSKSVTNKIYITRLTFDQTARYLHELSDHFELPKKQRFSSSQIKKIFDASQGLPGKINRKAQRILDSGPPRKKNGFFKK